MRRSENGRINIRGTMEIIRDVEDDMSRKGQPRPIEGGSTVVRL